jgi:hypothetical protein
LCSLSFDNIKLQQHASEYKDYPVGGKKLKWQKQNFKAYQKAFSSGIRSSNKAAKKFMACIYIEPKNTLKFKGIFLQ